MTASRFDRIIDVSQHQGVIDWNAAHSDGVGMAILRATLGGAGVDTRFEGYHSGAVASGVKTAFYHLYRPDSDGIVQAQHFVRTVGDKAHVFLAIDVEKVADIDLAYYAQNKPEVTRKLAEMVREVKRQTGVFPLLYTTAHWFNNYLTMDFDALFAQCLLWIAHYEVEKPTLPRCWSAWTYWQYTSSGSVVGIVGRVDMNRAAPPVVARFTLRHPVQASDGCQIVVTSRFGVPRDYDGDGIKDDQHEGTDFAPVGNVCLPNIVACADGAVDSVSTVGAYGNRVKLKHVVGAETYYTWYCHLSVIEVVKGAVVKRGQVIGVMGSSGNSTGIHLHLNLQHVGHGLDGFVIGDAVDPEPYIEAN